LQAVGASGVATRNDLLPKAKKLGEGEGQTPTFISVCQATDHCYQENTRQKPRNLRCRLSQG
jgi:hypothetical protein